MKAVTVRSPFTMRAVMLHVRLAGYLLFGIALGDLLYSYRGHALSDVTRWTMIAIAILSQAGIAFWASKASSSSAIIVSCFLRIIEGRPMVEMNKIAPSTAVFSPITPDQYARMLKQLAENATTEANGNSGNASAQGVSFSWIYDGSAKLSVTITATTSIKAKLAGRTKILQGMYSELILKSI